MMTIRYDDMMMMLLDSIGKKWQGGPPDKDGRSRTFQTFTPSSFILGSEQKMIRTSRDPGIFRQVKLVALGCVSCIDFDLKAKIRVLV